MTIKKDDKLLIIVPVFNEAENLHALYSDLKNLDLNIKYEILFVNDCSTDNSIEIIRSMQCNYLDLTVNLGIGGAMQSGYIYAVKNNFSFTVQVDGDGQHPPSEIKKLLTCMQESKCDVVIGSRYLTKQGFQSTILRRIGINFLSHIIKVLCGFRVKDVTSGLRLFNKEATKIAKQLYPDEYPEPESIILFSRNGLKICETPVTMMERKGGVSSIRHFLTVYYMFKVSLALIFTNFQFKSTKNE
jgi:glycosyltransferase involved in cell wall biosynthesis